jgi:hypothetical protein
VESDSVGVVESSGGDVGVEGSLLGVENTLNILVELVSGILGQGDDLSEELGEVRQILAEKASFDNNSLPGVRGSQLTTKKLRLASNAKTRSSLGVLERKFGKANRKARKRLVASTGLGHNSELSSRTVSIPRGNFEASHIRGLV